MKQRDYKLDIVRIVACLMVVLMHSPMPNMELPSIIAVGNTMITMPCIGLFFIVSGYLLLPVKTSMKDFLTKRLWKVVWPTLVFTLFYIIVNTICDGGDIKSILKQIASIPFGAQGNGVLWFMYTLIGLYLIAPIISPFIEKATRKELDFIIGLWAITLLWPYLMMVLSVNTGIDSILHSFSGYAGYFILGFYLKKYPIKINTFAALLLIVMPFVLYIGFKKIGIELGFKDGFSYLSFPIALMTLSVFMLLMKYVRTDKLSLMVRNVISDFSNCSFGIYLLHIFVMRRIIWNMDIIRTTPPICTIILIFFLTTIITWAISHMISRTLIGKFIIGYNRKK